MTSDCFHHHPFPLHFHCSHQNDTVYCNNSRRKFNVIHNHNHESTITVAAVFLKKKQNNKNKRSLPPTQGITLITVLSSILSFQKTARHRQTQCLHRFIQTFYLAILPRETWFMKGLDHLDSLQEGNY